MQTRRSVMMGMDPMQAWHVILKEWNGEVIRVTRMDDERGIIRGKDTAHMSPVKMQIGHISIAVQVVSSDIGSFVTLRLIRKEIPELDVEDGAGG
mmetsp:Transcript_3680/g.6517  ORF Transcript_3680/g.6517 Transcript_3680/m.6517 type:complete len:95 (+) Transcript_3680:213-497(+)